MEKPYTNLEETGNYIIRMFDDNVDPIELKWHRDREDREIECLETTDWMIQLDNELPRTIDKVVIKKGEWHRLIKGNGSLKIKIIKT